MTLHTGDCLDVMPTLAVGSVDAVVTDPPYGLGFMGKAWDGAAGPGDSPMRRRPELDAVNAGMSRQGGRQWAGLDGQRRQARDAREYGAWCETWAAEMLRVAKPGAYLLAFGGTRTVHRMTCAIEDAGWVIRDVLVWAYAQGFPKSRASLKPAWEPIVMARKPGASSPLQIDAARLPTAEKASFPVGHGRGFGETYAGDNYSRAQVRTEDPSPGGRWPANVVLTDPIFDGDVPGVVGGGEQRTNDVGANPAEYDGSWSGTRAPFNHDLSGTYSRFFLIPKADRAEREPVLSDLPERVVSVWGGDEDDLTPGKKSTIARRNTHPTVKPLDLMRHLVRLVTPPGGTVLDPFLGSGTTALACEMEGFPWVGIEREPEYVAIAEARLLGTQRGMGLVTP